MQSGGRVVGKSGCDRYHIPTPHAATTSVAFVAILALACSELQKALILCYQVRSFLASSSLGERQPTATVIVDNMEVHFFPP
jgi:hypothetical protein